MDSAEHLDDRAWRPGSDGEHLLQRRLGTVDRADRFYDEQVLDHLNVRMREFIGRQEMFFLATSDRHGECDSTFRAGPPGFLRVLDARTVAYPEYRGNGVLASLGNIQENPHLGILMVDFFRDRIGLHVNGRARVVEDAEMRAAHPDLPVDPVPGRRAVVWVEVTVEEAYIHCAKHIPHLQRVPAQRRTGGADGRQRALSDDRALEHGQERDWGTDDVKRKGGDFFGAAADAREGRRLPPTTPAPPPDVVRADASRPDVVRPDAVVRSGPRTEELRPADPNTTDRRTAAWRTADLGTADLRTGTPHTGHTADPYTGDPQAADPRPDLPGQVAPAAPAAPTVPAAPAAPPAPAVPADLPVPAADPAPWAPEPAVAQSDLSPVLRRSDVRPAARPDASPETWRAEAERVLAEAHQRAEAHQQADRKTQQPFSGWFR